MREIWKHQAWIVLATGLAVLTNLGTARLWDEDEPKNATCASEMLARGDWVVPTFNGELRTDKPILLYWCMLPLYHLLGVTEFSARLTSAMCGMGTVLLTYHLGRRLFRPEVGLWAGVLLGTSLMFDVASRAATPDALLIFFSTLALWFFVEGSATADADAAVDHEGRPRIRGLPTQWSTYFRMYGAMAMAVLAKGPVGLVLPTAVIGLYLLILNPAPKLWRRESNPTPSVNSASWLRTVWKVCLSIGCGLLDTLWPPRVLHFALAMRPQVALVMAAVIALPWYVIVGLETDWAWPAGFLLKHNVGRYMAPMEGHDGPPFYHLLSLAVGFFPGSIFLVPMGIHVWRRLKDSQADRRGYLLAICWLGVYLAVFSLAGTKLPSYVTPTYPALALLTGAFMAYWITQPSEVNRRWVFAALAVYGTVGLGIVAGLTVMMQRFMPSEQPIALLGLIPVGGAAACLALWHRGNSRQAAIAFSVSATAFSTALFGWALVRIDHYQEAGQISRIVAEHSSGNAQVVTYRVLRPSWVFYARQELQQYTEAHQAAQAVNEGSRVYLLATEERLPDLQTKLSPHVEVLGRVPRFLRPGHIVVLGQRDSRSDGVWLPQTATREYSRLQR